MKIEVRCPECQGAWMVDERNLGEAICPRCSPTSSLLGASAMGRSAKESAAGSTTASVASAGAATAIADPPVTSPTLLLAPPTEDSPPDEIVCPRCKLHFVPRERQPEVPDRPRLTVLVVEDLEYFCQVASDALSPRFEVRTARTSDEARAALALGGIDLLVLDLTLDGSEGGRKLLEELRPKPCPILIYTAQDESEMYGDGWDELSRLGADDIVIKGMRVADSLMRKAATLLGISVDEEDSLS